jgi:pimeloyl-ACP methyl ester carboxylesterase
MRMEMTTEMALASGGALRLSHPPEELHGAPIVLGLGGSVARASEPRWSASITWLLGRLSRELPEFGYAELRYHNRNWRAIAECVRDAREALAILPADSPVVPIGFSMGGGIAIAIADDPRVRGVIGLAPWVPEQIPLEPLRGKRLALIHGSRDRYLPLLPGVPPEHSRRLVGRASDAGALLATLTLIEGAIHAIAVSTPFGLVPLPHARTWSAAVAAQLRSVSGEAHARDSHRERA